MPAAAKITAMIKMINKGLLKNFFIISVVKFDY